MKTEIIEKIREHYEHAKQKHPYFCDILSHDNSRFDSAKFHLEDSRERLRHSIESGVVCWDEVLRGEMYEALVEISNRNTAAAVEECYDAIAVLLRVVDVLEGRQELGNPAKGAIDEQ